MEHSQKSIRMTIYQFSLKGKVYKAKDEIIGAKDYIFDVSN